VAVFEVGAGGVPDSAARASGILAGLAGAIPASSTLPLTGAAQKCLKSADGRAIFAVCAGLTAENLADLYRSALASSGRSEASVSALGVVTGPGSFTGLRLGCAFANGLALGRQRECWSVSGVLPAQVPSLLQSIKYELHSGFAGEVSGDLDDPFAALASFADLFVHLDNWARSEAQCVDVLEPVYGREPTPVLKLRQQHGETLS
jgi:hypothetical protein